MRALKSWKEMIMGLMVAGMAFGLLGGSAPTATGVHQSITEDLTCHFIRDDVIIRNGQGQPMGHAQRGAEFRVRAKTPDGSYAGYLPEDGFDAMVDAADVVC